MRGSRVAQALLAQRLFDYADTLAHQHPNRFNILGGQSQHGEVSHAPPPRSQFCR